MEEIRPYWGRLSFFDTLPPSWYIQRWHFLSGVCLFSTPNKRPRRLARPRTPPFHGDNTGSNPVGDANRIKSLAKILRTQAPPGDVVRTNVPAFGWVLVTGLHRRQQNQAGGEAFVIGLQFKLLPAYAAQLDRLHLIPLLQFTISITIRQPAFLAKALRELPDCNPLFTFLAAGGR